MIWSTLWSLVAIVLTGAGVGIMASPMAAIIGKLVANRRRPPLVVVPITTFTHHVREKLSEAKQRTLRHGTERFQHFLLHVQGVHP